MQKIKIAFFFNQFSKQLLQERNRKVEQSIPKEQSLTETLHSWLILVHKRSIYVKNDVKLILHAVLLLFKVATAFI
jgi:hypothetical protein